MADRRHAEVSEILGRQLREACLIDRVFPECLLVASRPRPRSQAEIPMDSHTWPHSSTSDNRRHVPRMRNSVYPSLRGYTRSLAVKCWYRRANAGREPNDPHSLLARRRGNQVRIQGPCRDAGVAAIAPGFAMLKKQARFTH